MTTFANPISPEASGGKNTLLYGDLKHVSDYHFSGGVAHSIDYSFAAPCTDGTYHIRLLSDGQDHGWLIIDDADHFRARHYRNDDSRFSEVSIGGFRPGSEGHLFVFRD